MCKISDINIDIIHSGTIDGTRYYFSAKSIGVSQILCDILCYYRLECQILAQILEEEFDMSENGYKIVSFYLENAQDGSRHYYFVLEKKMLYICNYENCTDTR